MSVWPYTTRRWERVRQQKMMRNPLCEVCLQVGEIVPAEVVDHRKPSKKRAIGHIDGVVSLLMALAIAVQPRPALDIEALIA